MPQSFSEMDYLLSSTHWRNESLSNTVSLMSTSYPFPFNPQGSHSGLIKILNEKGDLFLTYFMTYFFICTLLENCMLGFDTLYVTDAEMFPDSCMTKPFSHWAVKYHVHSGHLPLTVQDLPTQGRQVAQFLSDLQDSVVKMTVLPQDLLGPSLLTSPGAAQMDNCHPTQQ